MTTIIRNSLNVSQNTKQSENQNSQSDSMKEFTTKLFNSRKHLFNLFLQYTYFIIGLLCLIMVGNGRYESFISKLGMPDYMHLVFPSISLISFVLWVKKLFQTYRYNYGEINFSDKIIYISKNKLKFSINHLENLELLLNPFEDKNVFERTIKNGASNNWVVFDYNGEKHRFEFLLLSKQEETLLLNIVTEWRLNGSSVFIGDAKDSFLDTL